MPSRRFYIKDLLLIAAFDLLEVLAKTLLYLLEDVFDFWASTATELRDVRVCSFPGELQLAFANLNQLSAALDEGVDLGEYGVQVEVPFRSFNLGCFLVDDESRFLVDFFPFSSALDTIPKIVHALLDIAFKHVVDVDALLAAFDDFIGDLMQQSGNAF